MSKESVFSALRSLAVVGLTWLVASGKLTQDEANTLVHAFSEAGPILTVLGLAAYGAWKRSPTNVVKSAAKVGGVTVNVDPASSPPSVVIVAADPQQPNVKIETK